MSKTIKKSLRSPYKRMTADKLVGSRKARGSKEAALVQVALDEGLRPQREVMALAHTLGAQTLDVFDRLIIAAASIGNRALALEERKIDSETALGEARQEASASIERARIRADGGVRMIDRLVPAIERAVETMKTSHPDAAADIADIDAAAIIQAACEDFVGAEPDHEPESDDEPDDEPTPRRRRSH